MGISGVSSGQPPQPANQDETMLSAIALYNALSQFKDQLNSLNADSADNPNQLSKLAQSVTSLEQAINNAQTV
jgi:hypothetical protein